MKFLSLTLFAVALAGVQALPASDTTLAPKYSLSSDAACSVTKCGSPTFVSCCWPFICINASAGGTCIDIGLGNLKKA
ncbi:hypothetical protein CCMSSC00406_0008372 [Pleurotus cornucopiae]|uniref:Uncharacterized protein n=1 Tax=Pleurotus cornucopiae TaxID=5321 RepID=A0ACB7J715_PLECO|nr:hypothetical protein CCMSSC00406_0008372 [Pleurotus cornucopiae]